MFSFFYKPPTPFRPVLAPLPPRQPCSAVCNEQTQSFFFSNLPAEIRNEIYKHVFTGEARELLSVEAHPLSLLLTCHKVNHEATNLAFSCHAFQVANHLDLKTFISMRNAISHLSSQQIDAITALSYDLGSGYLRSADASGAANILTNSILLFPNLSRFELRILRGRREAYGIHQNPLPAWCYTHEDARKQAGKIYAPHWFATLILSHASEGHAYAWQAGQSWKIEWPASEDDVYLDVFDHCDWSGNPCFKPFMSPDAVGNVRGVHMCPCTCGEVSWTSADLVQETGRRIAVDTVYYGSEDRPLPPLETEAMLKARLGLKAVILKEGTTSLNVVESQRYVHGVGVEATSLAYEADEKYWEAVRRRNGDWAAIARGFWKEIIWRTSEDRFPGSWALGEGDWGRAKEKAEDSRRSEMVAVEDAGTRPEISYVGDEISQIARSVM